MNRGMGKRLLFAGRRDFRQWLARLGCSSRRGEIDPEAFVLMGTHFHMMARTQEGTISYALMRIQNGYARWFNRRNQRDGTPSRGRFRSKPVSGTTYFKTLVRYIDHNPVRAGVCSHPGHYQWGSARYYLGDRSPLWLSRTAIETFVGDRMHEHESR